MSADDDLDRLLSELIAEEMAESPTRATSLGWDGHDSELGDLSETAFRRRSQRDARWRERLDGFDPADLDLDHAIDRDLALSTLRGREVLREWEVWRRDPATYLGPCLSGVFSLFLHGSHEEGDLVRHAADRLRQVPDVLAAGKENLTPELSPRLLVERAAGQCAAGVRYARELVPAEVPEGPGRDELAAAGEVAATALEDFGVFLADLAERATGDWRLGEDRYSALLEQKELLGYGAAAMRQKGRAAYDELSEEMSALAREIDGTDDWRAVLERLNADHPDSPEAMRDRYDEWTQRSRDFLAEHGIVTLPDGEECAVVPSPPFQRPVLAVASYAQPPAFKPLMKGHFFVPFPPDGTPPEEVQKRLETNSLHSIPTVAVHEAYPGHHWHLTWAKVQKVAERPLRAVCTTSYFAEGWALYAERVMRERGFFSDPRHDLCHLDARIFRAARIVVDTSLHIGDMSFDEAVEFMRTKASLSEPTARAEVGRYCTWPTQAASYLTGSLEIERIRGEYERRGLGDVRRFNDTIAGSGVLPIALAERAVLQGAS